MNPEPDGSYSIEGDPLVWIVLLVGVPLLAFALWSLAEWWERRKRR